MLRVMRYSNGPIAKTKKALVSECLFTVNALAVYLPGAPGVRPLGAAGAPEDEPAPEAPVLDPPPAGLSPDSARPEGMGGASGGFSTFAGSQPTRKLVKTIVQNQLLRDIRYLKSN